MSDYQLKVIALVPDYFTTTEGYKPYANSNLIPCPNCGQKCWIGPKQRETRAATGLEAICYDCVKAKLEKIQAEEGKIELDYIPLMSEAEEKASRAKDKYSSHMDN
jgi:hypothetical protein